MSEIDKSWAITSLTEFVHATDEIPFDNSDSSVFVIGSHKRSPENQIAELAYVAESILDRVLPAWRREDVRSPELRHQDPWGHVRVWASRCIAALKRQEELSEKLGDSAPHISVNDMHPWVWDGARSLWKSSHFREAVESAVKKVNAETQNKISRRDINETDLYKQAFSLDDASEKKPRLRRMQKDGSDTYRSVQRGAMAFAEGIIAAIRNPLIHESEQEISPQEALEYLAVLSVLARWVDDAEVETAP